MSNLLRLEYHEPGTRVPLRCGTRPAISRILCTSLRNWPSNGRRPARRWHALPPIAWGTRRSLGTVRTPGRSVGRWGAEMLPKWRRQPLRRHAALRGWDTDCTGTANGTKLKYGVPRIQPTWRRWSPSLGSFQRLAVAGPLPAYRQDGPVTKTPERPSTHTASQSPAGFLGHTATRVKLLGLGRRECCKSWRSTAIGPRESWSRLDFIMATSCRCTATWRSPRGRPTGFVAIRPWILRHIGSRSRRGQPVDRTHFALFARGTRSIVRRSLKILPLRSRLGSISARLRSSATTNAVTSDTPRVIRSVSCLWSARSYCSGWPGCGAGGLLPGRSW